MPLDTQFFSVARVLMHPGMGTENVGPLLYALACMRRPRRVLAVGLGYSTLFLLQALADAEREAARDRALLDQRLHDPARVEVLLPEAVDTMPAVLVGCDDFSDDDGRLGQLQRCVDRLELGSRMRLHRCRYQDLPDEPEAPPYDLVWIDCGHQLDYAELCNRFWPKLQPDGGLLGMHYTHVDVPVDTGEGAPQRVVVAGPWVNAVKRQLADAGPAARFELLSLVEPHKARQGSVTLLRRLEPHDGCRPGTLAQENLALYGTAGSALETLG